MEGVRTTFLQLPQRPKDRTEEERTITLRADQVLATLHMMPFP